MKNVTLFIIGFVLILGCSRSEKRKYTESKSSFDLRKDIYNFSEKMENGDTIILNAKIGVCLSYCNEHNSLWKEKGKIFIQSEIKDIYPNNDSLKLGRTEYTFDKNDSLNFENLFISLKDKSIKPNEGKEYTFQIIYKYDTIEFFPGNLVLILQNISYYNGIKGKIYPDENFFKPDLLVDTIMK
jgi:hypothetical protein